MKIRGADFIRYHVSNLSIAARFYCEVLGLTQTIYSEEWQWAEFDCGNITLGLKGGENPDASGVGACLALAVEDLPAVYAELTAKGVRLKGPPQDYGVCQALEVLDPDGNKVLLHHRADGTFG